MVDVYLVGVGGQGIITATRIVGDAAVIEGKQVLLSETHGMAQRGGSVACSARIGDVSSPLIPDGGADAIVSFELLETLRAISKAFRDTVVIASTERVVPLSVSTEKKTYPTLDAVRETMLRVAKKFIQVDARAVAEKAGVPVSSNIVMVGALSGSGVTGLKRESFERAIEMNLPAGTKENLAAFSGGFEVARRA